MISKDARIISRSLKTHQIFTSIACLALSLQDDFTNPGFSSSDDFVNCTVSVNHLKMISVSVNMISVSVNKSSQDVFNRVRIGFTARHCARGEGARWQF